jgi:TatD DNase family protein
MKIFESHAHLDSKDFDKDRNQVIEKCREAGVEYIINIGCDEITSKKSIDLAAKHDFIYATVGYHPHDADKFDAKKLRSLAKRRKVVAIGEIGLDYYRNLSPKNVQIEAFEEQLKIAIELDLPIVIHDREAHEDTLEILLKYKPRKVVFHCFAGDILMAKKVIEQGWFISFTGTITYKNSKMSEIIKIVPEDKFFIETDCPYLTPIPHRGKRNAPYYLRHVIEKIADIKRITPKRVAEASFENAKNFFGI